MDIPVTFELEGKTYHGDLSEVSGSGSTANFHLTVNGMHWGRLSFIEGHPGFDGGVHAVPTGWRFNSPSHPGLSELTEYFGYVVQQWVDCQP